MATNISRLVATTLNISSGSVAPASLDIPAIITDEVPLSGFGASNYAKLYSISELSTVATDFTSGTSGDTYKAASALAAPTSRVKNFYVIKRATVVAGEWDLVFDADLNTGDVTTGTINGEAVSNTYATSMAASLTALASTIQALAMVDTAVSNGTDTITITFESEVEPSIGTFTAAGGDEPGITSSEQTAAVNITGDIDNATAEASTNLWYCILPTSTDQWLIEALGAKLSTLADRKMALCHSTDSAIYTAGSDDVASRLNANSYRRIGVVYHDDSTEFLHCRIASSAMANPPGTVQFGHSLAGKNLTGATAAPLTAGQISIAQGKYANVYAQINNNINLFGKGVMADGQPIESVRDIDHFMNTLEAELANNLTNRTKTPFNKAGRQLLQSWGDGPVQRFTGTILDPDSTNVWFVPAVADVPTADKTARLYSGCIFNGAYLNGIIKISATVNISI